MRKYWLFIRSKTTLERVKSKLPEISLNFVWNDLLGAGFETEIMLSRQQLTTLHVKLWNCKYILLKVKH